MWRRNPEPDHVGPEPELPEDPAVLAGETGPEDDYGDAESAEHDGDPAALFHDDPPELPF